MYEMSQRHPVWVMENHVNPCNSVERLTVNAKVETVMGLIWGVWGAAVEVLNKVL